MMERENERSFCIRREETHGRNVQISGGETEPDNLRHLNTWKETREQGRWELNENGTWNGGTLNVRV